MPEFLEEKENGVILRIKLVPNSSKDEIVGLTETGLRIKISAPPNENKANKKLIIFLAKYFDVAKTSVEIVSGEKSPMKAVLLKDKSKKEVLTKLSL